MTLKSITLKNNIYYLALSVGETFESYLAGWSWIRVFHWAGVKTLVGAAVSWRLEWGWRTCFVGGSLTWLMGVGLISSLAIGTSHQKAGEETSLVVQWLRCLRKTTWEFLLRSLGTYWSILSRGAWSTALPFRNNHWGRSREDELERGKDRFGQQW